MSGGCGRDEDRGEVGVEVAVLDLLNHLYFGVSTLVHNGSQKLSWDIRLTFLPQIIFVVLEKY